MQVWPDWLNPLRAFIAEQPAAVQAGLKIAGIMAGSALLWLVAKQVLHSLEKRAGRLGPLRANPGIFRILRRTASLGILLLAGTALLDMFALALLRRVFNALLIFLLALPVKDFLLIVIGGLQRNVAQKTESKIDDIIFDLLNRLTGAVVWITAAILAMDIIGVNVMPFIAGAGIAGLAVGLAAKDTLSNLIAGILLIVDRPFEIGDRIEVWSAPAGSATWGDVIDIGLRATRIRTTDNIVIIIPNNEIMKRDIVNYTALTGQIRVRVNIGVAYEAEIEKAKRIIIEVAESLEWVVRTPPPKVVVRNFGESSVDLQLRVWIKEARRRMDTISNVIDRVKTAFDKAGIEIPYPKRSITVVNKTPTEAAAPVLPAEISAQRQIKALERS